jgi:hypothetical protein
MFMAAIHASQLGACHATSWQKAISPVESRTLVGSAVDSCYPRPSFPVPSSTFPLAGVFFAALLFFCVTPSTPPLPAVGLLPCALTAGWCFGTAGGQLQQYLAEGVAAPPSGERVASWRLSAPFVTEQPMPTPRELPVPHWLDLTSAAILACVSSEGSADPDLSTLIQRVVCEIGLADPPLSPTTATASLMLSAFPNVE